MLAGTRTPSRNGRTRRLMAMAVAAACWLAVPAGASAQQDPALDVSGLTNAATGAVAATGSAVEDTVTAAAPLAGPAQDTVTRLAGTVARATAPEGPVARLGAGTSDAIGSVAGQVTRPAAPVAGAAERVAHGARRTVDGTLPGAAGIDETLGRATGVDETLQGAGDAARGTLRDSGPAGAAAGQGSPRYARLSGPAGGETSRASRLQLRGTAASERLRATLPGEPFSPTLTPLIPGPPIGVPGMPAGGGETGSAATAGSGALGLPSDPEPVSGTAGGSSAAGASVSFFLGGLALLLATLSLAGPALRRRLPRRPVIAWPAAFVPLLERPG
jgi:hypothetical protein